MMKYFTAITFMVLATTVCAEQFGAPLTLKNPISVETAIANNTNSETPILIKGKIDKVCQVKGCWMGFTSSAGDIRVTFKDYGFFVPLTVIGKTVQAEGTLEQVTLSLKDSKHLVEDGGGDPNSVTEPLVEYQMVASGVVVEANSD